MITTDTRNRATVAPLPAMTRQDLDITQTPLGTGFETLSLFSAATRSQRIVQTVWAAHTQMFRAFPATPRLDFQAQSPGTGKTVNMQVTLAMSHNPLLVGYSSQAALYSILQDEPDTVIGLDEIDKATGSSRRILWAVINDGYQQNGQVIVVRGGHARKIPVFTPLALVGLGKLPEDTATRAIAIMLEKGQPAEQYLSAIHDAAFKIIGDGFREWLTTKDAQRHFAASPKIADVKGDPRFRLIVAPLQAIATYAGMGEQFSSAITELQTGAVESPAAPLHALMIADLAGTWPESLPRLTGQQVITLLQGNGSGRWRTLPSERAGELIVAGLFRAEGIRSHVSHGQRAYWRSDVLHTLADAGAGHDGTCDLCDAFGQTGVTS